MNYESDSNYYSEEEESSEEEWLECVVDRDYEISNKYPHNIRRKGTKRNIAIKPHKKNNYLQCMLNQKCFLHHRIVALQFIPNDDPEKNEVDHINRIRNDNHISNLRWVNHTENYLNRGCFVYTDEIDEEAIKIEKYGNRKLENYYYDCSLDQFYHKEYDGKYRLLNVLLRKDGVRFVVINDTNNVRFNLYPKKFKADLGLE